MPPTGLTPNGLTDKHDARPSFVDRLKRLAARHRRDEAQYERIGYSYLSEKARGCAERVERQLSQYAVDEQPGNTGE